MVREWENKALRPGECLKTLTFFILSNAFSITAVKISSPPINIGLVTVALPSKLFFLLLGRGVAVHLPGYRPVAFS